MSCLAVCLCKRASDQTQTDNSGSHCATASRTFMTFAESSANCEGVSDCAPSHSGVNRVIVDLDHDTVCAACRCRQRHRRHEHGQVRSRGWGRQRREDAKAHGASERQTDRACFWCRSHRCGCRGSQRMTCSLPLAMMYSALIRSSFIVAAMPRFNKMGFFVLPSSLRRSKFCMLRAPT